MADAATPDPAEIWRLYTSHRAQIETAVRTLADDSDDKVAFLGAGPCFDIDIAEMLTRFARVSLVDLNARALTAAVRMQHQQDSLGLTVLGGVDVTGLDKPHTRRRTAAWIERLNSARPLAGLVAQDGVVSLTMLSQLIDKAVGSFWPDDPGLRDLIAVIRRSHVRVMLETLRPGGWGLLITDVVASDTVPALLDTPSTARLERILSDLAASHNHFIGLIPQWLIPAPGWDPRIDALISGPEILPPWVWQDRVNHARLVVAMTFRRKG